MLPDQGLLIDPSARMVLLDSSAKESWMICSGNWEGWITFLGMTEMSLYVLWSAMQYSECQVFSDWKVTMMQWPLYKRTYLNSAIKSKLSARGIYCNRKISFCIPQPQGLSCNGNKALFERAEFGELVEADLFCFRAIIRLHVLPYFAKVNTQRSRIKLQCLELTFNHFPRQRASCWLQRTNFLYLMKPTLEFLYKCSSITEAAGTLDEMFEGGIRLWNGLYLRSSMSFQEQTGNWWGE